MGLNNGVKIGRRRRKMIKENIAITENERENGKREEKRTKQEEEENK